MSSAYRYGTRVSRLLESLRLARGLRPSELAACLGASKVHKIGSMIRSFELYGYMEDYWFERLVAELRPDPDELRRLDALDLIEAQHEAQLRARAEAERSRRLREAWARKELPHICTVITMRESGRSFASSRQRIPEPALGSLPLAQEFAKSLVSSLPPDTEVRFCSIVLHWSLDQDFCYRREPDTAEPAASGTTGHPPSG